MQAFQAKIKLLNGFFIIILLMGCNQADTTPATAVPPAENQPTVTPQPDKEEEVPTPTETAVSALETVDFTVGERSIGDPYAPELGNTGYDVLHYTLQLAVDPTIKEYLEGHVLIQAMAVEDNLGELSLDFIGFVVEALTVNGQSAAFSREDDKLVITLPAPLASEERFEIAITYLGEMSRQPSPFVGFAGHLGMFFAEEDTIYVLSEPDGSRYWFPNNDHPRDKATYRFEITVPEGQTAVANGTLVEVQDSTYIWEHKYPMASYLATIAVGEYNRIEDTSATNVIIRNYSFPNDEAPFRQSTRMVGEAIDWMGDLFGVYPYEEYGYVTVHAPGVSLETQTMVLLSTEMLNERTVIHELAHMWFGDWVSLHSWGEMWRNEGFATYISMMWEHRDDPEALDLEMEGIRAAMAERTHPPLKNPARENLFNGYIYFGGAVMVHDLRQEMGDAAFFSGLQQYFQQYGGSTASDEEFIAVMEEAAGKPLTAFFADWFE